MVINYLHKIGWFIGLVLLQVLILNNVHIAGYATPFLYIYLILKFESETPRNTLMLWAFFENIVPSIKSMGIVPFLKYLVVSVFIHHAILLTIEFFSFAHIGTLLLRIVASALLTITCIMAIEGVKKK